MTTHIRTALGTLGISVLVGIAATGCDEASSSKSKLPNDQPPVPTTTQQQQGSALTKAESCDDLVKMLKADATTKLNVAIDEQIKRTKTYGIEDGYGYGRTDGVVNDSVTSSADGSSGAGVPKGAALPSAPTPGSEPRVTATAGNESAKAASYSETNTQVAGVDEADIVKTDGKNLYVLHGDEFLVVRAWPVADLALASRTKIDGSPREMFVEGNKAVVYSTVNGAEIFQAAGVTPKSIYNDHVAYAVSAKGQLAFGGGGMEFPSPVAYVPLTKVTVLTLDGTAATVASELYFEGDYASARRVGSQVRTVLNGGAHGPVVNSWPTFGPNEVAPAGADGWIAALEKTRAQGLAEIAKSTVGDWLPYTFAKVGKAVTATPLACESYYVPPAGSADYGLVQIQAFDVNDPTKVSGSSIVGHSEVIYGSADSLYMTATAWSPIPPFRGGFTGGMTGSVRPSSPGIAIGEPAPGLPPEKTKTTTPIVTPPPSLPILSLTKTQIHKFSLEGNTPPVYVASGNVPGNVLNQFSLDEHDGRLRVTTTEDRASADYSFQQRSNHLFVLEIQDRTLQIIGDVGDLAPGESIFSTRFVGDRAYVVTAVQQKDPLFVIDLKIPQAPKVLGELVIPGFSNYMHPIDSGHLLTIGEDGGRNLALQIFDVTDPLKPKIACDGCQFSYNYSASSEAQSNHKAFSYYAAQGLLTFPLTSYGFKSGGFDTSGYRSSLELFKIDVTKGIRKVGSVDHSSLIKQQVTSNEPCGVTYLQQATVQRGLFLEDSLFSLSTGGVMVNRVSDLGFQESVSFPAASFSHFPGGFHSGMDIAPAPSCFGPPGTGDPAPLPAPKELGNDSNPFRTKSQSEILQRTPPRPETVEGVFL